MTGSSSPEGQGAEAIGFGKKLSHDVSVGPCPTLEQLAALSRAGFVALVDLQPDAENGKVTASPDLRDAATQMGLDYEYVPVEGRNPPNEAVACFEQILSGRKPIYAFCRTGTRATIVWALAKAKYLPTDDILATCEGAGFDMRWLEPKLEMRRDDPAGDAG